MNITLRNVPDKVYRAVKREADRQGRSLSAQIIHMLALQASEAEHRRRIRNSRKDLERFVASLPRLDESTRLIREDRKR